MNSDKQGMASQFTYCDTADEHFFVCNQHLEIRISGIVQGVGFRPFIFSLANKHSLRGFVQNNSHGVLIRVEGHGNQLQSFIEDIRTHAPIASRIDQLQVNAVPPEQYSEFKIIQSEALAQPFTQISPDLALCPDCRKEMENPKNRRFHYPFINCTNCGPRFSIIEDVPYDRPLTTMSRFAMCSECNAEYENPVDRRFHAQPIACPQCGPKLMVLEFPANAAEENDDIAQVVSALRSGKIALIQGVGGFHLACDARNDAAVRELRRRKHREEKPLAVMFPSQESLLQWCFATEAELELIYSPCAPIVLLPKQPVCPAASSVAPDNPALGGMIAYSPLHVLLLAECGFPLVMTSANCSEEPIAYKVEDAIRRMSAIADVALTHNREIHMFADDSVTRVVNGSQRILRRSRGYVPLPIQVPVQFRVQTLAFGPQMKNTFCLGRDHSALLSQHLGDLDNEHALAAQHSALEHFLKVFHATPELIACDTHPDYASTRLATEWATERSIPLVKVQHHHAHHVSCLTENGITEPAIGLALDGTGYGLDGSIWGGEILVGNAKSFNRVGHLQEVPLLGGERVAKEPWRMALAWLYEVYGDSMFDLPIDFLAGLEQHVGGSAIATLLNRNLRDHAFPKTSSVGRLFDAVSALVSFGFRRQFEGQAAMQLEWLLAAKPESSYHFMLSQTEDQVTLSPVPMFFALVEDLDSGVPLSVISKRFHDGLVEGFVQTCLVVRERTNLDSITLSGGCFQNAYLLTRMEKSLTSLGFRVLSHKQVPTNDGGIALGQAVIANAQNG
jgi:hydrogenase maturation protein HypF